VNPLAAIAPIALAGPQEVSMYGARRAAEDSKVRSYVLAVALVGCALAAATPSPSLAPSGPQDAAQVAPIDFAGLRAQAGAALQSLRDMREQRIAMTGDAVF
jgi:hypothetical protein